MFLHNRTFTLKVDIFASKKFFKTSRYVSRYFDHSAWKVDAFSFHWPKNIYVFPPLIQISKVMNKIWSDEVEDIAFITPAWKSLFILPSLLDLLIDDIIFIPSHQLLGPMPTRRPFKCAGVVSF